MHSCAILYVRIKFQLDENGVCVHEVFSSSFNTFCHHITVYELLVCVVLNEPHQEDEKANVTSMPLKQMCALHISVLSPVLLLQCFCASQHGIICVDICFYFVSSSHNRLSTLYVQCTFIPCTNCSIELKCRLSRWMCEKLCQKLFRSIQFFRLLQNWMLIGMLGNGWLVGWWWWWFLLICFIITILLKCNWIHKVTKRWFYFSL